MRDLALLTFVTLDGVMQAPMSPDEDRSGDFAHGGWAGRHMPAVMPRVLATAMSEPYDALFGRKTYEVFAGHWPDAPDDDPVARILNSAKKYVVTRTLSAAHWQTTETLGGDPVGAVRRLKASGDRLLQVHGSWQLCQALLGHDLVDELRLCTCPVTVGDGKRLFEDGLPATRWSLTECEPLAEGVVLSRYRRSSARAS